MIETSVFLNLVVSFLTPMLLSATGGDRAQAEAAAIQTVTAYATRNAAEFLLVGQSIALGIAVLGSVSLSMTENMPINLILRLRANAISLHRAAERCRCALPQPDPQPAAAQESPLSGHRLAEEPGILAEVDQARQRVADFRGSLSEFAPETPPATMEAAMAALEAESERRIAEADAAMKSSGAAIPRASASPAGDGYFGAAWSAAMAEGEMKAGVANPQAAGAAMPRGASSRATPPPKA